MASQIHIRLCKRLDADDQLWALQEDTVVHEVDFLSVGEVFNLQRIDVRFKNRRKLFGDAFAEFCAPPDVRLFLIQKETEVVNRREAGQDHGTRTDFRQ